MRISVLALCLLALANSASAQTFTVPVVYNTLPNGLRVVVSENHAAPVVIVEGSKGHLKEFYEHKATNNFGKFFERLYNAMDTPAALLPVLDERLL